MTKEQERLHEIAQRKAELLTEVGKPETTTERLAQIKTEADALTREEAELRSRMDLTGQLKPRGDENRRGGTPSHLETRANGLRATGRLSMPLFWEQRSLLVSSGTVALPTSVSTEIGELPGAMSSIVDDVDAIDATGTGSWRFPYKKTDAVAATHVEGQKYAGTGATYGYVDAAPSDWGVLDEISEMVSRMTNVAYMTSMQSSAYLALRRYAKAEIVKAVLASDLLDTKAGVALDATYLRNVALNFGADESVAGGTKLYLCKADLATLGAVRGTNEKKPVFEISFSDENNGTIQDGGLSVRFSILSDLTPGQQLYGQPRSIKMPMWGPYEIRTDNSGEYFARGMIGIRANAQAAAVLAVYHGMQLIKQAAA